MRQTNTEQQHSIVLTDMWHRAAGILFVVLWVNLASWAVDGTFQGRVIDPPPELPTAQGWIYVQGPNHMLRRVEVSHANIVFGESVPLSERHKCGMDCLTAGLMVRITAEQDPSGEWRAKRVEILRLTTGRTSKRNT